MSFLNACSGVFTVFLIGLIGFVLARRGLVTPNLAMVWPKFVTTIVLPPYLLRNITSTFEHDQLIPLLSGAVIPFLSIFLTFGLAAILTRMLHVADNRKGIFRTGFATSSSMNIGLPINIALFGDVALPFVLLYFIANAITFWTMGNYSIAHDGESAEVKFFSRQTLKQICSPPLIGFALGMGLVFADMHLPMFIDKTFKYVGDMAIALSIMYVGVMLNGIRFSEFHFERDMLIVLAGRFCVSPLCILLLSFIFPIPPLMRNVFIIQSSLPVMMNVAILSGYYKADIKFSTMITSVSTILSLMIIPLYMALISYFS